MLSSLVLFVCFIASSCGAFQPIAPTLRVAPRGIRSALSAVVATPPAVEHDSIDTAPFKTVPLTGITLDAALKMRCDLTGASYAMYWANVRGTLMPVREYSTPERRNNLAKLGLTTSYLDASIALVEQTNGAAADVVAAVRET
eukprot:6501855-Prymnesium_polylepis.1